MYGIIYKITNIKNGKIYIGKTKKNINIRFQQHLHNAFSEEIRFKHLPLINAIRKYGTSSFVIEKIDEAQSNEELNNKERKWIKDLNSLDKNIGYNVSQGGEGNVPYSCLLKGAKKRTGRKHSSKWKQNISKGKSGKPLSEDHKKHLSENNSRKHSFILLFKDGHTEPYNDSWNELLIKTNTKITKAQLISSSIKGEFRNCDFYILNYQDFDLTFNHKYRYSKEKCFYDPIKKEIIDHCVFRSRKQHEKELYKNIDILKNYTKEKQLEKEHFIKINKDKLYNIIVKYKKEGLLKYEVKANN